jgi:hypothetical protein
MGCGLRSDKLTVIERGSVWLDSLQLLSPSCDEDASSSSSSWLFTPISTRPAARNRFILLEENITAQPSTSSLLAQINSVISLQVSLSS